MLRADDQNWLSLLYHLNSEPWPNEAAPTTVYEPEYKTCKGARVTLPPVVADASPLPAIAARRSCREFAARPLALVEMATLLHGAYGVTREAWAYGRAVPSAGGLYPLELYVVTRAVETLADGVYHFAVRGHALTHWRAAGAPGELAACYLGQNYVEQANALFLLTAVFDRTQRKYGPRGYRYALLEAGHVAQNLCLLATERGLGAVCAGGFVDTRLNRWLGVDGVAEAVLYSVALGHPAPESP